MSDLIERRAAIDVVANWFKKIELNGDICLDGLRSLPSAEPETIYCKDCKHWYPDADTGMACEFTNMSQPDDGFCNWAERRTDE